MNWLNLEIRTLRSPAYIGSDPTERATWLNVLAHCCEQENGGRIAGARLWKDRQWQQLCGVTLREVTRTTRLLLWDGDDLVVWGYSGEKEREVRAKRDAGKARAARRWGGEAPSSAGSSATSSAGNSAHAEGERKEKEKGNGREREGVEKAPAPAPKRAASDCDEEWVRGLEAMDCYRPVNVRRELGKAQAWAQTNHRGCTRKFFINWLNRALTDHRTIATTSAQKHDPKDDRL